jgi:hypothetical protein
MMATVTECILQKVITNSTICNLSAWPDSNKGTTDKKTMEERHIAKVD